MLGNETIIIIKHSYQEKKKKQVPQQQPKEHS